jgi:hypothetical protein
MSQERTKCRVADQLAAISKVPRVDGVCIRASIEALQAPTAIWVKTICSIPAALIGIEMTVRSVRVEMVDCGTIGMTQSAGALRSEITL